MTKAIAFVVVAAGLFVTSCAPLNSSSQTSTLDQSNDASPTAACMLRVLKKTPHVENAEIRTRTDGSGETHRTLQWRANGQTMSLELNPWFYNLAMAVSGLYVTGQPKPFELGQVLNEWHKQCRADVNVMFI
jgi:hypothetical protein